MEQSKLIPNTTISEKLFIAYFLQSFRLGSIVYKGPQSKEEFSSAYLSSSLDKNHEVLLQFPQIEFTKNKFELAIVPGVHNKIKNRPPGSAFYVGHVIGDLSELDLVQTKLKTAKEFLRFFILIDASSLPKSTVKIRYKKSKISGMPVAPICKFEVQLKTKLGEKSKNIETGQHFSGMQFRDQFFGHKLGFNKECSSRLILCPGHLNNDI